MSQAIFVVLGTLAGILVGYWLRHLLARSEKQQAEHRAAELAISAADSRQEISRLRSEAAAAQDLAAGRAGFEALCGERERAIVGLTDELRVQRGALESRAEIERKQAAKISQLETELENERRSLKEKVELLESARKTLSDQFQALAGEILEQKSKSLSETSRENLGHLITPLQNQIKEFRDKVEQAQTDSKTGVTRLETLIGSLGSMNQQLAEEARNLSTALRGSAKAQGDWGEFILRDLLDKAGLREGEAYKFQQSFASDGETGERARNMRTDVILHLPGNRHLVIDSKVSLNAYTDCVNAQCDDDRKVALKAHMASVKGHIASLAKAGYHRLPDLEAPDFVVMFVPVEPAFLMALQGDPELWADAYKQGILLVGPTTLLYVIRIIHVLWQQERQARNVREVMDRGTELYEKFVGFVTDMEVLGDSLRKSGQHYENAMKKLADGRGNLIRRVELLKKLGLQTNKALPKKLLDRAGVDQEELELAAEAADEEL